MFSGKTSELIRRINGYPPSTKLIALKPAIDDRYSPTDIVSHDGQVAKGQTVENAQAIIAQAGDAEVVAIDETHFFDEAIVQACRQLADRGTKVICSGLDRDMWGDVFPQVQQLSRIAQTTVLTTTCKVCGRRANRTQRTVPLVDANLVGGPEAFEPRCEKCFTPPASPKPTHTPGLTQ